MISFTRALKKGPGRGGGGTPLYKPYRHVPPHQVGFFAPFWSENGYGFRGNYGVYECTYRFNSKWVSKKEKYANSKWIWIIFYLRSNG